MTIRETTAECFVIHYKGMPLDINGHMRKVYLKLGYAKNGLLRVPASIREECEIVKYTPE